jgi:glycosyltransferase involved in cell wall biosynthesis
MEKKLSIVVPTYNNFRDLELTLSSIIDYIDLFELIIVDSSSYFPVNFGLRDLLNSYSVWTKPEGVYSAINFGIKLCRTEFVMTLNSGDVAVNQFFGKNVIKYLYSDRFVPDVIVGSQNVVYGGLSYKEVPDLYTIWPHQSVIYRRSLHDKYGFFSTDFRVISDQLFFESIKADENLCILFEPDSLTIFDVTGISSQMSLENLLEYRLLNKIRGKSNLKLYLRFCVYYICLFFRLDYHRIWHFSRTHFKKSFEFRI